MIPQRLGRKPSLAISKIIVPFPPERLDIDLCHSLVLLQERWFNRVVEFSEEVFFPEAEGFCVVGAYVFDCVDYEGVF